MDVAEATRRWDAFLAKIRETAQNIFAEAEQGCAMLLDLNNLDSLPMSNAWTAIENQIRELSAKVDRTFAEKVEPVLEEAEQYEERDRERKKGERLQRELERTQETTNLRIFAEAARKILEQARANLAKEFRCSQCRAPLTLSDRFFRSRHVPCPYCKTVNTFVPGTKVMAVEYFCCHHLARQKTQALYEAWVAAEERMRARDADLAVLKAAEHALAEYTLGYLRARIEIVPEYEKDLDKDLKGKMAFFYEEMSRNEAWKPGSA